MKLDIYHQFPEAFLTSEIKKIRRVFPHPSLIKIEGKKQETLFISALLHGNEHSSFYVLKHLASWLKQNVPERSLMILIGNVWACEANVRHLEGQVDFNRIWDGQYQGQEMNVINRALEEACGVNLFASIDIHNNTGKNPLYSCVNYLKKNHLKLAEHFSPKTVYYTYPRSTQSVVFSEFCPAVTLECGQSAYPPGIKIAFEYILKIIGLKTLNMPDLSKNQKIYNSFARIEIDKNATISFDTSQADIMFSDQLEKMNFIMLPSGYNWVRVQGDRKFLRLISKTGEDITDLFFKRNGNFYSLTQTVIPAMLTRNINIIRQDCLGYLMSEVNVT